MTLEEAVKILECYNIWRRGKIEDYVLEYTPTEIGIAIDTVINHVKKL